MNVLTRFFQKKPRITKYSDEELRERLTSEQYQVTQYAGTEAPYSGEYLNTETAGTYHCRVCDAELFSSEHKTFGTGWPGFNAPIDGDAIAEQSDWTLLIPRTETLCADCGAHLGHVFPEGIGGRNTRYCINSASLRLEPADVELADVEIDDTASAEQLAATNEVVATEDEVEPEPSS